MAASGSSTPRVTFLTPEKPEKAEEHVKPKKLGKLTVKYNRKEIQRRLNLEEWVDAKLQELYQSKDVPGDKQVQADIDIDDLLDLSVEDQKRKLQAILKECARPTGEFTAELVQRLKGLRKISALRRK